METKVRHLTDTLHNVRTQRDGLWQAAVDLLAVLPDRPAWRVERAVLAAAVAELKDEP